MIITETSKVIRVMGQGDRCTLADMQSAVGGYIEIVCLGDVLPGGRTLDMVINDDGKYSGMARNALATVLAQNAEAIFPDDYIAGPALMTSVDDEGESYHLTADEEQKVMELILAAR